MDRHHTSDLTEDYQTFQAHGACLSFSLFKLTITATGLLQPLPNTPQYPLMSFLFLQTAGCTAFETQDDLWKKI